MWDLSSLTRDGTLIPCIGRQSPKYWTTREVLIQLFNSNVLCKMLCVLNYWVKELGKPKKTLTDNVSKKSEGGDR